MKISFPQKLFDSPKPQNVSFGKDIAKKSNILFCGIGRNVEKTVEDNIKKLKYLGCYFDNYDIFIYENDSTDNTKCILNKCNINYLSENREDANYKQKINDGEDYNHYNRCMVLARCRNKYLEYARQHKIDFDYICVLDYDILGWSYRGFFDSIYRLNKIKKLASISAYGILSDFHNKKTIEETFPNWLMYDSFAFRPLDYNGPIIPNLQAAFNRLKITSPQLVRSNFGGMCIYKKIILKVDYSVNVNSGCVDCDHVVINDKLSDLGYFHLLNNYFAVSYSRHRYTI